MVDSQVIEKAEKHFAKLLAPQLERVKRIKSESDWIDYSQVSPVVSGTLGRDGIGPAIVDAVCVDRRRHIVVGD